MIWFWLPEYEKQALRLEKLADRVYKIRCAGISNGVWEELREEENKLRGKAAKFRLAAIKQELKDCRNL